MSTTGDRPVPAAILTTTTTTITSTVPKIPTSSLSSRFSHSNAPFTSFTKFPTNSTHIDPTSTSTSRTEPYYTSITTAKGVLPTPPGSSSVSIPISSASLSTDGPNDNRSTFSHNLSAVIGVTVGATIPLLFAVFWVFFAYRRRKRSKKDSVEGSPIATHSPTDRSFRPPLHDDDETDVMREIVKYVASSNQAEDAKQTVIGTEGSALKRNTSFGQAADVIAALDVPYDSENVLSPSQRSTSSSGGPVVIGDPNRVSDGPEPSSWFSGRDFVYGYVTKSSPTDLSLSPGESTAHVYDYEGTSSDQLAAAAYQASSASDNPPSRSSSRHGSTGGRKTPDLKPALQGQTPPTSFALRGRDRPHPTLKGFLDRLRRDSTVKNEDAQDVISSAPPRSPHESLIPSQPSTPSRTPSSLLHPAPSQPISSQLRHPYHDHGAIPEWSSPRTAPGGLTLPPEPSPPMTSDGLLDPRLISRLRENAQHSSTSLRDHVDYSRPFGGLVNNGMHNSTTTFETQSAEPEH